MSTNNITPQQALEVLNIATLPANIGKLSRQDYANIEVALQTLVEFLKANPPKEEDNPKQVG